MAVRLRDRDRQIYIDIPGIGIVTAGILGEIGDRVDLRVGSRSGNMLV